jgi:glucans biosynthesis protein C
VTATAEVPLDPLVLSRPALLATSTRSHPPYVVNRVLASAGESRALSGAGPGKMNHVVYIDWLKFLVVYGIVVYHASLPFNAVGAWLIGSRDRDLVLTAFAGFTFPWGIPILFLLSGAGAYFGLRSKTATAFLRKRILRLGVPLIAGIVLLSPLQSYLTNGIVPKNPVGLLSYYPQYLGGIRFDWNLPWLGRYGYHLWFLGYLLEITAVTLPFLEWIRGERGQRWVARLAGFSQQHGGLLIFAIPLTLSQLILRSRFPNYQDWADTAAYTTVFLAGYVMAEDRSFDQAIRRNTGLMVRLGVVSTFAVGAMLAISGGHPGIAPPSGIAFYATYNVMWSLNVWCWCMAVMALGVRWLNKSNPVVRYGSESALPVYVIHHPVVIILGSAIVGWNLPLWPRFLLLVVGVFVMTLTIYEFGVRRTNVTRFIFGLGPPALDTVPDVSATAPQAATPASAQSRPRQVRTYPPRRAASRRRLRHTRPSAQW